MTSEPYALTLPVIDDDSRPFWDAARAGELRVQQCAACGHLRYPIARTCPVCLAADTTWKPLSGRGSVFARVVYHQAFHPAFKAVTPYTVALVQLDEGPRMLADVIDLGDTDLRVGERLIVTFDRATDDVTIPRFRRDDGTAD